MIDRNELMNMAREAGFQTGEMHLQDGSSAFVFMQAAGNHCGHEVARLIDIVLERAAVEIEAIQSEHTPMQCAHIIRALKTQGN